MPRYEMIQKEGYNELEIIWTGLTLQEQKMANELLKSVYKKDRVRLCYYDSSVNHLVRSTGEIWLNNNKEPFESDKDFEAWLELEVPKVEKALCYCKYTDKLEGTIRRD
ncbi:hypothetical protein CN918_28095 [Priestia megaterium]|nr:hypothetical protein CN918_28095 [Priestia megaterium]